MTELQPIVRTVSGKGIIKIPEGYRKARRILLYVDVIRPPSSEYANYAFNPSKSFYGHISFNLDSYVLDAYDINFKSQVYDIWTSQSTQNLLALICALENILDSFVQYAVSAGKPFTKNNSIKEFGYSTFLPDTLKFCCYADSALRLSLQGEELDRCDESHGDPAKPPPPPPPPPNFPAGIPVEVDSPYSGTSDNGDTVPNPIDRDDDPPPTQPCESYVVTFSYDSTSVGSPPARIENQTIRVWGVVGAISVGRDRRQNPQILLECQGLADYENCGEFRSVGITTQLGAGLSVEFSNATIDNVGS